MEELKIIKTVIKQFRNSKSNFYCLEVSDQYGRWWSRNFSSQYKDHLNHPNFEEIKILEQEEIKIGTIDKNKYHIDGNRVPKKIKKQEEIWYVYTYDLYYQECYAEEDDYPEYKATVHIITEDSLVYEHDVTFKSYEKVKKFALKIKEKGVVNLEYWNYLWNYDYEGTCHEEFEDTEYYDDSWKTEVYDNIGGSDDGEPRYMSEGMWALADGTFVEK